MHDPSCQLPWTQAKLLIITTTLLSKRGPAAKWIVSLTLRSADDSSPTL
jgi:hypothetical protein